LQSDIHDSIKTAIQQGDFASAQSLLEKNATDDSEWLYLSALCHRRLGQPQIALKTLDRLLNATPKHGRAFQERGHILRELGQTDAALAAYGRACQENPSLHASWRAQAEILLTSNRLAEANRLKPHIERLAKMPRELVYVLDILSQGFIAKAETACRAFLQVNPHHPEAMRLLADIAVKLNIVDEAEFLLESAVLFAPDDTALKLDYISVLRKRQKFVEAKALTEALLEADEQNVQLKSLYAIISMQMGDYPIALTLFDQVLQEIPEEPVTLTSKGHALKTIGQTDQAIDCYRRACGDHVIHGEAWQSLANLKTYRFSDQEIERMRSLADRHTLRNMDRVYLNFALGKAYEDNKDFDAAFARYAQGNSIKRGESRYVAEHMTEEFDNQKLVFSRADLPKSTCVATDPIFILGMPRAGSTLLEQILSSHSQVDGTQELPNILTIVHRLRTQGDRFDRQNYPQCLTETQQDALTQFGEQYIEDTRVYRQDAPFFIDKMPNNFRHIGLIKHILPNAKIIDARRHPLSCTFSCFKQLFAEGQEFSYDLADLGRYYRDYVNLMDFWHQCFPGEILHVQYEDVVEDLDQQVQRILDYCELPFEDACTRYWETERAVKTPSSEQVRQPIFKSGVENWQHFESHLSPLKEALGATLENYRPTHVPV